MTNGTNDRIDVKSPTECKKSELLSLMLVSNMFIML